MKGSNNIGGKKGIKGVVQLIKGNKGIEYLNLSKIAII